MQLHWLCPVKFMQAQSDVVLRPQNYVHFLSPTANGSWFPPGPANMIHTTFRPVCQVMYAEALLWTVRLLCARTRSHGCLQAYT